MNIFPASITCLQNQTVGITGAAFAGIDNVYVRVSISVSNGVLHVDLAAGVIILVGKNDANSITLGGMHSTVCASLQSLRYTPNSGYAGSDILVFYCLDNAGVPLTDIETMAICVMPEKINQHGGSKLPISSSALCGTMVEPCKYKMIATEVHVESVEESLFHEKFDELLRDFGFR